MEILIEEIAEMDNQNPTFERSYEYTKTIASGAFGIVKAATDKSTGKTVAVKIVNKCCIHSSDLAKIKREVTILKQLNHPNLINFINYSETNTKIFIVTEYIKDGTLKDWLDTHSDDEAIDEERIAKIIYYLLQGVSCIHSLDICHKDIKPDNIMFNNSKEISSLKLVDFGLSTQGIDQHGCSGTLLYMAPELFSRHSSYTKEVDIWSVGIIGSLLLNKGQHPFYFKGQKKKRYFQEIKKGYSYNTSLSQMANDFLNKMLEPELNKRYTAFNALNHPWITRQTLAVIPLTLYEKLKKKIFVRKLRYLFLVAVLLKKLNDSFGSNTNNSDYKTEGISDYIEKLHQVSFDQNELFKLKRKQAFNANTLREIEKNKSIIDQSQWDNDQKETTIKDNTETDKSNNETVSSPIKTTKTSTNNIFLITPLSRNEQETNANKKITDNFRNNHNSKSNSKCKGNGCSNVIVIKQKELSVTPTLALFKIKTNRDSLKKSNRKNEAIGNNNIHNLIQSKKTHSSVNINMNNINTKRISNSNSTREHYVSLKHSNYNKKQQIPLHESPMKQRQKIVQIQTTDCSIVNLNPNNNTGRIPLSKSSKKPSVNIYQITKKHFSSSIDMNINIMQMRMKLSNVVLPKLA